MSAAAPAVPLIGLTGGMGAGKSTALAALSRHGAEVLSTDEVVHELYQSDDVRDAVVARWGQDIAPGGIVDRAAVAARAFESDGERAWLEGLLWPLVGERVWAWVQHVRAMTPAPRAAVIEVPLLFESGMDAGCDATLVVVSDEELTAGRTAARGHAAAGARGERQLSQEEKARRATYVVRNDGTEADLEAAVSGILDKLSP